MKVASVIFVMAAVVLAVAIARPEGNQAEEQSRTLLEAEDAAVNLNYDRDDLGGFAVRNTRQNIRWTGVSRGPSVLIRGNFSNKQSCVNKCRTMNYPNGLFTRSRECRCLPPLNRTGVVEFD